MGGYESDILQIFRSRTALRRVVGDAPIFGMHYSLSKPGHVSLGDKVPQIKKKTQLGNRKKTLRNQKNSLSICFGMHYSLAKPGCVSLGNK